MTGVAAPPRRPALPGANSAEREAALAGLVTRLGFPPAPATIAAVASGLLHRSYRTEKGLGEDNERLEFLGDSVIGLVATELLMERYPEHDEGGLSKLRAAMVSRAILGRVGIDLGVGALLQLGTGEERSGGRDKPSNVGSALEAICGALYQVVDWTSLRRALRSSIVEPAHEFAGQKLVVDYKSRLQEQVQRRSPVLPEYTVIEESGPDHQKFFEVEARLGEASIGRGTGSRKKSAENEAARDALRRLAAKEWSLSG